MMHCFGDVQQPRIDVAEYLEGVCKDYVTALLKNIDAGIASVKPDKTETAKKTCTKKRKNTHRGKSACKSRKIVTSTQKTSSSAITGKDPQTADSECQGNKNPKPSITLEQLVQALQPDENSISTVFRVVAFLRNSKNLERGVLTTETDVPDMDDNQFMFLCSELDPCLADLGGLVENQQSDDGRHIDLFWSQRLMYKDKITTYMTKDDYMYFSECSKVSFTRPQKRKKFIKWMDMAQFPFKCNNEIADVIGQLVYEYLERTVRGVLDMRDKKNSAGSRLRLFDIRQQKPIEIEDVKTFLLESTPKLAS